MSPIMSLTLRIAQEISSHLNVPVAQIHSLVSIKNGYFSISMHRLNILTQIPIKEIASKLEKSELVEKYQLSGSYLTIFPKKSAILESLDSLCSIKESKSVLIRVFVDFDQPMDLKLLRLYCYALFLHNLYKTLGNTVAICIEAINGIDSQEINAYQINLKEFLSNFPLNFTEIQSESAATNSYEKIINVKSIGNVLNANECLNHFKNLQQNVLDIYSEKNLGINQAEINNYANLVAISSLVLQMGSAKSSKSCTIDWESLLDKRNAGKYIQYTCAKLSGIERNSPHLNPSTFFSDSQSEINELAWTLIKFPSVLESAANSLESTVLMSYLIDLASQVSSATNTLRVKGLDQKVANDRLLIFKHCKNVLVFSLQIFGINSVDQM